MWLQQLRPADGHQLPASLLPELSSVSRGAQEFSETGIGQQAAQVDLAMEGRMLVLQCLHRMGHGAV